MPAHSATAQGPSPGEQLSFARAEHTKPMRRCSQTQRRQDSSLETFWAQLHPTEHHYLMHFYSKGIHSTKLLTTAPKGTHNTPTPAWLCDSSLTMATLHPSNNLETGHQIHGETRGVLDTEC